MGSLGHYWFVGICALATLLGAGCASTSPSGASVTSSLTVEGRTLEQIRLATIMVFQKNGYEVKSAFGRKLVFEKKAGAVNKVLYGGWMDASVWVRVKVRIEELKADVQVLDFNVYRVKDRGDPILEEEKETFSKSKPFKELLAQIKAQLDSLWPVPGSATPSLPTVK